MCIIKAEFQLDENGNPKTIFSNGKRHYKIALTVENAPQDAMGVTYHLHHTYLDPVRETYNGAESFREQITSFGDYHINAVVRSKNVVRISGTLFNALLTNHGSETSPPIQNALSDIKSN